MFAVRLSTGKTIMITSTGCIMKCLACENSKVEKVLRVGERSNLIGVKKNTRLTY